MNNKKVASKDIQKILDSYNQAKKNPPLNKKEYELRKNKQKRSNSKK